MLEPEEGRDVVKQRVLLALSKAVIALVDRQLESGNVDLGVNALYMKEARTELIKALGDTPHDPCALSKLEIASRVAKEMQEMRDKYPLGAVIRIDRINQHEHMAFLYPEDQRIKGIGVMNEWMDRNRVRTFEGHGYFVLTPDGYTSWLPGACVMSR